MLGAEINVLLARLPQRIEYPRELVRRSGNRLRGTQAGTDAPVESSEGCIAVGE